jgi:hypothetical protein
MPVSASETPARTLAKAPILSEGRLLEGWMRKEGRNVPLPAKHFLTVIRIALPACGVVAYHVETVGKGRAFGGPVRSAERNPVPGERILLLMEPRVPTGHNPVIPLGHGKILSERKALKVRIRRAFWREVQRFGGRCGSSAGGRATILDKNNWHGPKGKLDP